MKSPNSKNKADEASLVPYNAKTLTPRSTSDGRKLTPCSCNISMEEGVRIEQLLASEEWNRIVQGYDDPNAINPRKSKTITGSSSDKINALVPLTQRIKAIDIMEGNSQTN